MSTKNDIFYFMKWSEFFLPFSDEEKELLTGYFGIISFQKDETIYSSGTMGIGMGIIIQGRTKVLFKESGEIRTIAVLKKGDIMGELSLLDDNPRSADVVAGSEVTAMVMSRSSFEKLLTENPEIGLKFVLQIARLLALRIRKENTRLKEIV